MTTYYYNRFLLRLLTPTCFPAEHSHPNIDNRVLLVPEQR
jgi:hypothetical protein